MSKTIDERVVEMKFDNRHFEQNVQTTMSTLDKLKLKLNLNGASKGLDNLSASANKINMNGLSGALTSVTAKFSALDVVGVTALTRITNAAITAGNRIVKALTIEPISTGFKEYETQINAVQTILANTQSKGTTIDDVNKALTELNKYADKTIYNFTEMTRNIGTFTAAGVDLETSVNAIQGIANLAAVSGSTSQQASTAMYQLSQALAAGTVKLMDWNSVVNAGMGGQVFQDALKETARIHGVAIDKMIKDEGSFRETLKYGWITSDILTETLSKFTMTTEGLTEAEIEANKEKLRSIGYTEEQIKGIFELGNTATNAATKVKTFTQLWDVLKEAAQSGWAQTWQIIVGDFEEAKALFSPLADFLTGIINSISEARNKLLDGAFGKSFKGLFDNVMFKKTSETIETVTKSLDYYQKMVNKIWNGDYKNQPYRSGLLEKEGHNYKVLQSLVNKGYKYKLTMDDVVKAEKKYGKTVTTTTEVVEKNAEATTDYILELLKLSDAELKALEYEEDQIAAFRELERVSKNAGIPLREFIENIDEIDGRWLVVNSLKNAGKGLVAVLTAVKDAWVEIFPPVTSDQLFNVITGLHKFSTYLVVGDDTADKLKRTLKGLFAILDMVTTLVTSPIKIGVKILGQLLKALDIIPHDILGFTATLGDAIVKCRDWLDSILDLSAVFEFLAPYIKYAAGAVKDWFKGLGKTDAIKKFAKYLTNAKDAVTDWFKGLKEADNIAKYIFEGLVNGLTSGAKNVINFIIDFGKQLLAGIKKVLGIHSPSTEFFDIGKNIVLGLFNGISSMVKMVYSLLMSVGGKLIEIVKGLDIGSIFTIAIGSGSVYAFVKIANAIGKLAEPFDEVAYVVHEAGDTLKVFQGVLKTIKFQIVAEAIKSMATAIAILAGSIVVLTMVDQGKMWSAVGAITVLMALLAGLTFIAGKYGGDKGLEFGKIALTLLALGVSMAFMAGALKTISKIDTEKAIQAIAGVVVMMVTMMGMMAIVNRNKSGFLKLGSVFTSMGIALLLMAGVAKLLGGMDRAELIQGTLAIVAFSGIIVGLMAATKLLSGSKNVDKIGKSISKIATAILIMMVVAKLAAKMEPDEMRKGITGILAFSGIIVGLMAATKLISGSKNVGKIGGAIFGISAALLMMVFVAKLAAGMDPGDFAKGILAITALGAIVVGLMAATKLIGKDVDKIGRTILMLSASIGLLAITAALLSLIDTAGLAKGIIAVGLVSAMMAGLIYVTKNVPKGITGTIGAIVAAIAVLAISLGVLSMIKPEKLAGATIALGIVLGMFALVVKSTATVKKAMGTILILTLAIGALGGVLYVLAQLPADRAIASSVALSTLLGAMAGVMMLLSKTGGTSPKALLGVLGMAALCIPLFLIVEVLSKMQNIQNAAVNAMALGAFMGILAVVQILCAAAGAIYTATGGMAMLGLVGMVALVGTLYLLMGALAIMSNIPNAITILDSLTSFMIKMTAVLVALAIVGPLALVGVGGMTALMGLIVAIGALAVGIGYLMEKIPALQNFLNSGIDVLVGIAGGIGRIIGAFAGGILTEVTSGLPQVGSDLSEFMDNASGFIEGASKINPGMMDGVKALAEAIIILTGANLLESLTSWLTGGSSLADFGEELGGLGTSMNEFATKLGTFDESKVNTINCACNAIKTLAKAAHEIPNDGGVAGFFAGENNIGDFATKLPGLGTNLNSFVTNLGTFTEAQVTTVDCAGKAIVALAQAATEIPNDGGIASWFAGENNIGDFAAKLPGLGTNLNSFVTNLGTFTDAQVSTVDCAGKAILALAKAASEVPNEGGVAGFFAGENDLGEFGKKLPELASNIAGFVTNLGTFTEAQVNTVTSACNAIKAMAKLGEIDLKDTGKGLTTFGENMIKFAKKIGGFVTEITNVGSEGIDSAISKIKDFITALSNIASNTDTVKGFSDSLKGIGKDGLKAFVKEFAGTSPKEEAKKALKALLSAAIDGAKSKKSDIKKEFTSIAEAAVSALCTKSLKEDAKQAGKDLVTGFANGIKNNKKLASDAGTVIGKAALNAAKKAIDSNSPSKEAEKLGNYFGQGLVIGIEDYESKTYDAGFSIADRAKKGLSRAISKVSDLITNGVDTQPTIRPVLDLSDVENGASHLNTMFNNGPSIGIVSNLRAISSGVAAKNQNGVNDDVVSAINKLRNNLNHVGGDTYNINGVTYDDGSNIKDAVGALIRAAKVERRV